MQPFEYANPTTLKDALGLLANDWNDAKILAGGTDLLSLMKDNLAHPKRLVNVKNIKELGGIGKAGSNMKIGATATMDDLMESSAVRSAFPSLAAAARGIGSPQIRNMGTVGGDLCQRPRCWYYRNHLGLRPMKDGKSLVEEGQNEFHAIFGKAPALWVTPTSLGPVLAALGAKINIASSSGNRTADPVSFWVAATERGQSEIAIKPNEIVTSVEIPMSGMKNAVYEVRQREGIDWPLVAAAVALKMKGNTVESASIFLGHVGPTLIKAESASAMLAGKSINDDTAAAAGQAATQGASPLSGNAYKVDLVKVAVKRALLAAAKA